ncbi:Transcriptional regulatory protein [Lachnellula willkommii]|uniref:Transcriptional regulatory protein n=1 Tax=Lachnellula willkommii TaxID=215461 RepID=A0A559MGG3_9HELO|nr:Transcriptional regulatory protein [Lachnellula willkommii]
MDQGADALLQAAGEGSSPDEELSEVDVDGDGSSSLSDIEDKDAEQDEDQDGSDVLSNPSDDENDSEAETERLEVSPQKSRPHQDVVLSSHNDTQHTPSKLHNQITADDQDDEEDDDPLSDAELSLNESPESPKSSVHDDTAVDPPTAPTSLEDGAIENKNLLLVVEADTRKRKRSIMAGSGLEDDIEEPLRKRTGFIMGTGDGYAIEEDMQHDEEVDTSHPISGNISADEGGAAQEDEAAEEIEEEAVAEDEPPEAVNIHVSPKRRGRKKKKVVENGVSNHDGDIASEAVNGDDEARKAEDENAENEGDDEAEAAQKNEEERKSRENCLLRWDADSNLVEKKRIALDQLSSIERQFSTFRDRLHEERLEQLNREEAMLRQDKPTHPEYLAMMRCIDARRDERVRVADTLEQYQLKALSNYAVAKRSQILTQYKQEVRDIREKTLEQLGKHWYEIQHDRRSYAGSVPDYTLKFPTNKQQQIRNQVAYSNEVSVLSGVAKYVGFPAAPGMAPATAAELYDDLEKMGVPPAGLPIQELAALRTVGSTSRFKPAEEQFIEQTPWANPQHPSHAHLLQRQTSAQQTPRTTSPFGQMQAQRRHSHQQGSGAPISGTFSNTSSSLLQQSKGLSMSGGRISPHNPFGNSNHSHTIVPSPLGSRQTSLSPQQSRPPPVSDQHNISNSDGLKTNGTQQSPPGANLDVPRDFPQEARREQAALVMGRF